MQLESGATSVSFSHELLNRRFAALHERCLVASRTFSFLSLRAGTCDSYDHFLRLCAGGFSGRHFLPEHGLRASDNNAQWKAWSGLVRTGLKRHWRWPGHSQCFVNYRKRLWVVSLFFPTSEYEAQFWIDSHPGIASKYERASLLNACGNTDVVRQLAVDELVQACQDAAKLFPATEAPNLTAPWNKAQKRAKNGIPELQPYLESVFAILRPEPINHANRGHSYEYVDIQDDAFSIGARAIECMLASQQEPPAMQQASAAPRQTRKSNVLKDEANERVRDYQEKHATPDHEVTVRELVNGTGVSQGAVPKLPAWRAYCDKKIDLKPKRSSPKAVALTSKLESTLAEKERELTELIKESEADNRSDPSPCDTDPPNRPRRVRHFKRV